MLIFEDGAQIRARICAPVHVYAEGIEYAVTLALRRTLHPEIRGEKNAVPLSDIMLDDARSAQVADDFALR